MAINAQPPEEVPPTQEVVPETGVLPPLPPDATAEEVAVWLTIIAESTWIENGVTPEAIVAKIPEDPLNTPIHSQQTKELIIFSPVVLWADFGFPQTPWPSLDLMMTAGSWIWGCEPVAPPE